MNFVNFKQAVAKQFEKMAKQTLYRTKVEKDLVWDTYLASFPEGTNPMFRKRTEHDCSCCRNFIRNVGNVVAIIDGKLVSIWDAKTGDEAYDTVSQALSKLVRESEIDNLFFHTERTIGTDKNFEQVLGQQVTVWNHFFVNVPAAFVLPGASIGPKLSETRALHDVLARSLETITLESIQTVQELIAQNSLYRGEEHTYAISEFKKLKISFDALPVAKRDLFVWQMCTACVPAVAKMRNTAIGTLLSDLSEGYELDDAVKSFEAKVAPMNYKRPTALVTKAMVEKAKQKITELGLTSALERRYATLNDISVNNLLFVDRKTRSVIEGDVFDSIASSVAVNLKNLDKVEEIPIEKFLKNIVPTAQSIEVLMDNSHSGNLMSLIAPTDPTANRMFKWDNGFSWSYSGDVADSIKERVKAAGGNVTGEFCCRLAWYNHDDLDYHMVECAANEIYYANKNSHYTKGRLDVDMNAGCGTTRKPVENIFYSKISDMKEGIYRLNVHQFCKRESVDVGFEVEIDILGTVYSYKYDQAVKGIVQVAQFQYTRKDGLKLLTELTGSKVSRNIWNVNTNTFQKVNVIMNSPNYWGETGTGNKHYFFMLEGCKNNGTARGFYNEFLRSDLDQHRKVIEMVGSKMRADSSGEQLSGLGFSSTQRNSLLCKVSGSFNRIIKVTF